MKILKNHDQSLQTKIKQFKKNKITKKTKSHPKTPNPKIKIIKIPTSKAKVLINKIKSKKLIYQYKMKTAEGLQGQDLANLRLNSFQMKIVKGLIDLSRNLLQELFQNKFKNKAVVVVSILKMLMIN